MLERFHRHWRGKDAAVWPCSRRDRSRNLLLGPLAKAGFVVRSKIRSVENPKSRDLEAHLRATEIALHIWFAEKRPGRMTISTRNDADQIFATLNLCFSGICGAKWNAKDDTQRNADDDISAGTVDHVFLPDLQYKKSPKTIEHTKI